MQPITRDLVIPQGTSWTMGWKLTSDGQPLVDSTWTGHAQVRETAEGDVVLHEWASANGTFTIADDGTIILSVTAATSSAWLWRWGVYDVEVSKGVTTHRILEGSVTVDPEVTRS